MKKFLPVLFFCTITGSLFAQDVRLNDSVIFINNKPVALYTKQLSKSPQRYNMEVYSFDDYLLIKAEVIKFDAPVDELKPFYYYELTFPPTADTFAMYIEDEAFPITLAKIIRDYGLINKNQLNKKNLSSFVSTYYGGPALTEKIRSFEDYLNETRYFNEQVKRDRTKPVTIINEHIIMQDGVRIGQVVAYPKYKETKLPVVSSASDTSGYGIPFAAVADYEISSANEIQILMDNGRRVDDNRYFKSWRWQERANKITSAKPVRERSLYDISKEANKNISANIDQLLMRVCYLIEDFVL